MTYIDYLNSFFQWVESNDLPGNAQLLYFKLLGAFNRAGWPSALRVDTLRLMLMADCSKDAAYRAREKLVEAGFLTYQKGKKGAPTAYFLSKKMTKGGTENTTENVTKNTTHIKTKTKKLPPTPQGALSEPNGAPKSALSEADRTFAAFWGAYPRKDGKAAARKKWQSLAPDPALLAHMLQAIKTMSASEQWQADGGRYIPMASTWLNQRRWEDVPPPGKRRRAVEVMAGDFDPIKALTGELWRARTLPEE